MCFKSIRMVRFEMVRLERVEASSSEETIQSRRLSGHALEDLVDPRLGHGELEEDADEADHDERSGRAQDRQVGRRRHQRRQFQRLQHHWNPQEDQHDGVEAAPAVLQVRRLALHPVIRQEFSQSIQKVKTLLEQQCSIDLLGADRI